VPIGRYAFDHQHWEAAREAWHERGIKADLDRYTPPAGRAPEGILMGGDTAAGKSEILTSSIFPLKPIH
jgi:hypothetical protein